MFCSKCGSKFEVDSAFCPECGAPAGKPEAEAVLEAVSSEKPVSDKKNFDFSKKKLFIVFGGLLVLLVLVFAFFILPGMGKASSEILNHITPEISFFQSTDGLKFFKGQQELFIVEDCTTVEAVSKKSDKFIVVDSNQTAFFVTEKGQSEIAEDVVTISVSFDFSTAAYTVEDDNALYVCDLNSLKSTEIASDVSMFALSPSGKYISYAVEKNSSSFTGYTIKVGANTDKAEEIGKNKFCFAISDDAKYMYIAKQTSGKLSIHLINGKDEQEIAELKDSSIFSLHASVDLSEMIISDGKETHFIVNGLKNTVRPPNISPITKAYQYYGGAELDDISLLLYYYDLDNLQNVPYSDIFFNCDLYIFNRDFLKTKLVGSYDLLITADNRSFFYQKEKHVYYLKDASGNAEPKEIHGDEDFLLIDCLKNGNGVYGTENDSLIYISKNGKSTEIADNMNEYDIQYGFYASETDHLSFATSVVIMTDRAYFVDDFGELFMSINGGKKTQIEGVECEGLVRFRNRVFAYYEDELWEVTDGKVVEMMDDYYRE